MGLNSRKEEAIRAHYNTFNATKNYKMKWGVFGVEKRWTNALTRACSSYIEVKPIISACLVEDHRYFITPQVIY